MTMLLVRMLCDGYVAANNAGQAVFGTGSEHELLFRFLESDSAPITMWLQQYFNSVIDSDCISIAGGEPDTSALNNAKDALEAMHPFFRHSDNFSIISEMLAYHLNLCLLRPAHIETQCDLEGYRARLKPLVEKLLIDSVINQQHPGDKQIYLSYPNPTLDYTVFEQAFYNRYIEALNSMEITYTAIHGLKYITYLQNTISHHIYWLVDASARYFSNLTTYQRTCLYRSVFSANTDEANVTIKKHISFADPRRTYTSPLSAMATTLNSLLENTERCEFDTYMKGFSDDNEKVVEDTGAREAFAQLRDNNTELSPDVVLELERAIQSAIAGDEPAFYEEYEVNTLYHLLFLELEQLIEKGVIVKHCRLCGRYFITGNMNIDYCGNVSEGETLPCSEIGSTRAFLKKLDEDYPLRIYNRAYKTHYARKMKGIMSDDEFDAWRNDARDNLEATRSGNLGIPTFEAWLKK